MPHEHELPDTITDVTRLMHTMTAGQDSAPPIAIGASTDSDYQRKGNRTVTMLEDGLCVTEGARYCTCFDSGVSATHHLLVTQCKPGDTLITHEQLYWGTIRAEQFAEHRGVNILKVDLRDEDALRDAMKNNPVMVLFEPISNPELHAIDIARVSQIAHEGGALVAVDNTLMPLLCNPLKLGVDIVMHSLTKYINGHGDALGGALLCNDEKLHRDFRYSREWLGGVLNPFAAYLHMRGLKTMHLRLPEHCRIARAVAEHLAKDPRIAKVRYPGLPDDPSYAIASKQFSDFGGVLTLAFDDIEYKWSDDPDISHHFKLVRFMASLGETETLAIVFHSRDPETGAYRVALRISVGMEDPKDLIADIEQAIDGVIEQLTPKGTP
jgi:cystathionine beta-lyase/cystathionine gamma-synthase